MTVRTKTVKLKVVKNTQTSHYNVLYGAVVDILNESEISAYYIN